MTSKKKMLGLSAAVVLSLSFAGQSFAASTTFTDLDKVAAKDKIISLQAGGFVSGVSSDLFLPAATLTASQGIQMIVKAFDLNIDTLRFVKMPLATDYYKNAKNDAWYADTLIIAANSGFDLPADLDPSKKWTKEEFAHQLMLAMEGHFPLPMINVKTVDIKDQDDFTVEYNGPIQRSIVLGITSLDAEGNFHPKAEITRAESAEMIYNAIEYVKAHPAPAQPETSAQMETPNEG